MREMGTVRSIKGGGDGENAISMLLLRDSKKVESEGSLIMH